MGKQMVDNAAAIVVLYRNLLPQWEGYWRPGLLPAKVWQYEEFTLLILRVQEYV